MKVIDKIKKVGYLTQEDIDKTVFFRIASESEIASGSFDFGFRDTKNARMYGAVILELDSEVDDDTEISGADKDSKIFKSDMAKNRIIEAYKEQSEGK